MLELLEEHRKDIISTCWAINEILVEARGQLELEEVQALEKE